MFKRPSDGTRYPTRPHPNRGKGNRVDSLPKSFKHYLYNYTYIGMLITKSLFKRNHVIV